MRNRPLCVICLFLSVFLCIAVYLGGDRLSEKLVSSQAEQSLADGDEVTLSGRVYKKTEKSGYQLLYLKENSIEYHQHSLRESKVIVYEQSKSKIKIGDILEIDGEIATFEQARNPGNFDQKKYYQRQGVSVGVWADRTVVKAGNERTWAEELKENLYQFRKAWKLRLYDAMGEREAGVLSAMLLGDKEQLDGDIKELYQVSGIGHILAISGLHLSLIGIGIYKLVRRISGSYPVGGGFGIAFLALYVLMIGETVSVCRAFIMLLFRIGADITGRSYDGVTALSAAALVVLLRSPLSVYDAGFWLSFGAVTALYLVQPAFLELPLQSFWASVSIQLVILPVLLHSYYAIPTYSMFLNLLVLPLMSVILVGAVAGSVLIFAPFGIGNIVLRAVSAVLLLYEKLCDFAVGLPLAQIVTGKPERWQIAVYYAALASALWVYRRIRKGTVKKCKENLQSREKNSQLRKRNPQLGGRLLPVAIFSVGILLFIYPVGRSGKLTITMLDVGQGDCLFVRGPTGDTYLIDGGSSDVKNVAKYRIEPFLKSQGVKELDYVFVSHGDADHINAVAEMLERKKVGIGIKTLVLPTQSVWDEALTNLAVSADERHVHVAAAEPGQKVTEEKLSLTCMLPCGDADEDTNENVSENVSKEKLDLVDTEIGNASSMVLKLSYGTFDMLFTGDLEGGGEENLKALLEESESQVEVLKVAHHGSKNSTSEEFLELLKPQAALISAGQKNRYGHPHEETLERLKEAGSEVYCTSGSGAVTIIVEEEYFRVEEYLE